MGILIDLQLKPLCGGCLAVDAVTGCCYLSTSLNTFERNAANAASNLDELIKWAKRKLNGRKL